MNLARRKLSAACRGRQKSQVAKEVGVSAGFIGAVLRGRKRPGPKVLEYLFLEAYECYRPKRLGIVRGLSPPSRQ